MSMNHQLTGWIILGIPHYEQRFHLQWRKNNERCCWYDHPMISTSRHTWSYSEHSGCTCSMVLKRRIQFTRTKKQLIGSQITVRIPTTLIHLLWRNYPTSETDLCQKAIHLKRRRRWLMMSSIGYKELNSVPRSNSRSTLADLAGLQLPRNGVSHQEKKPIFEAAVDWL